MFIEDNLSDGDWTRVNDRLPLNVMNVPLMTAAYLVSLEAISLFTVEAVHPIALKMEKSDRQAAILGLYYRAFGFCSSAVRLGGLSIHQQSLTSAERSCIELFVDLELLHRNAIDNGVEKFFACMEWMRLRAARRADAFFTTNPALDETPSKAEPHRELIKSRGEDIEAEMLRLYGLSDKNRPVRPDHWSNANLPNRAALLDKQIELLVVEGYDIRNFSIHTGLAGILQLEKSGFESLCLQSLQIISSCMLGALRIVGKEVNIHKPIPRFDAIIDTLDQVYVHAFADKILQEEGEAQRYFVRPGNPSPELTANGDLENDGNSG